MTQQEIKEAVKQYHESDRRKELERQYRESITRPMKEDLKEVIERLERIEEKLDNLAQVRVGGAIFFPPEEKYNGHT